MAARNGTTLAILAWHYHDDDLPGPDADVAIELSGLPAADRLILVHHYRVDRQHSNAFEVWKQMGSPAQPTPDEYAELSRAGQLALLESPRWIRTEEGRQTIRVLLPRQAVSLLRLELHGQPSLPREAIP
jgi:xylan 1,4-beta-xylosidase